MSAGFDAFAGHGGWPVFHRWVVPEDQPVVGRALVFHGYSQHSGRVAGVIDALAAAGFAVVAPDHRGHGRTARVPGDIEDRERILSDLAGAHLRLLGLGRGPVFAVAHSFGAALALRYAERHPDAFAGLVLNGVALRVPTDIPAVVRLAARVLARVAPLAPLQPFFDPTRSTRDPVVQQQMRDDPLVYQGRIRARTGAEVMRLIAEVDAELGQVRAPCLLTHGGDDRHVPVDVARRVLAALGASDKELRVFPGLLHETYNEPERDEVLAAWTGWLRARANA